MPHYYHPVDPECPPVAAFIASLMNDPMTKAMGAPVDEIMADFDRRHRVNCERCQQYGAANIEVREGQP
jgi:hypothetical protein